MAKRTIVKIGYTNIVFDDAETGLRFYAMLTKGTPVTTIPYIPYNGTEFKVPPSLEEIAWVRDNDADVELKQVDETKFALHWTEAEFKEKCRVQPTEIDGHAQLVEEPLKIATDYGSGTLGDIF